MIRRSPLPSLTDIVEACEVLRRIRSKVEFAEFEKAPEIRWAVERGIEIISEASRRLPDELKARHPTIPWRKVAGIGNVLRHDYDNASPPVLWALIENDLESLEAVCREELAREQQT